MFPRLASSFVVLVGLYLGACSSSAASSSAEPPAEAPPEELAAVIRRLQAEGVALSRVERLRSARELPECPEAGFRYRLHLQDGDFVNLSRYGAEAEAQACLAAYREMIGKAGASRLESFAKDGQAIERWFLLFPATPASAEQRGKLTGTLEAAVAEG